MPTRKILVLLIALVGFAPAEPAAASENLLRNGQLAGASEWSIVQSPQTVTEVDGGGLRVHVVADAGKGLGEIRQAVRVTPHARYRLTGEMSGDRENVGHLQVKLRHDGKEVQRIDSGSNGTAWAPVSLEFNPGEATEAQVLLRWRQRPEHVGASVAFRNLSLEQISAAAPPPTDAPLERPPVSGVPGQDHYLTPDGAGDRSGRDFANAMPARGGGLQAAWDALGPGKAIHLGSGTYLAVTLRITAGHSQSEPKSIVGVDTGGGLPLFRGGWNPELPKERIEPLITSDEAASSWSVRHLRIENYGTAVHVGPRNTHVAITDVDITATRDAFILQGPDTRHVTLRDCDVRHFTKRGVRIRDGVSDATLENVHADAGGQPWALENFPIGFHVMPGDEDGAAPNRDIRFIACSGRNSWHMPDPKKYWNGDGFAVEGGNTGITFERCEATGNTDGGWDVKAPDTQLIDCVAADNKRNYRIWYTATLTGCRSETPRHRGGTGGAAGLWLGKDAHATVLRTTFTGDAPAIAVESGDGRQGRATLRASHDQTPPSPTPFDAPEDALTIEP